MRIKCPKCQSNNPDTKQYCGECGTQLIRLEEIPASPTKTLETPTEELTTGSTFAGRYQIIEELGKGGMGKVYRVLDKELKEEAALKLIRPEIASDKKTLERFRNELKLARKISHKNVGRMYELMEEKGTRYITMEYVPGEDLKRLIRKVGQFSAGKTISIAKQVCEGLVEAHRLGVVHRDLKPQNIMVDEEGNARILDFGIARSLKAKGITGAGVMVGTPEYMSPEQAEVKDVDQRSDIYSLGVILYEMVTGRVPFEGETPLGIAMKHKSEEPPNPRELNAQIPEDLSRVILRCMEKNKDKRYQSAGEVSSELANIEKGIPTTEKAIPKRKPITSKEITVTFGLKKLFIPALVIIALVISAVIIWQLLPTKKVVPTPSGKHSIAVLPFEDISPQKDQEYFCDGLAEELINALSNISELRVVARTSAFSFKGREMNIRDIGKELNVETVFEGSVRKAGDQLRVTAQLIDVADGYHLWSEKYDRKLEDVFAIQDEISLAIVEKLKLKLLSEDKARLIKRYTKNQEAYNLYLHGLYFWNKRTYKDLRRAIEIFSQAIEKDPNYALAYVGLANCYNLLSFYGDILPSDSFPFARKAALKALEIDKTLAEVHSSLAYLKFRYDWDFSGAEEEFKYAIELNPNYATAYQWYGELLSMLNRNDEAIEYLEQALELDPVSLIINSVLGWNYHSAQQTDRAYTMLNKTIEMDPNFSFAHFALGNAYLDEGKFTEAIAEFERARDLSNGSMMSISSLGSAYARAGKHNETRRILDDWIALSKQKYISSYWIANLYEVLGNKDKAFEWLEKAYEERTEWLIFINTGEYFKTLRSDTRFKELLKKIGLE